MEIKVIFEKSLKTRIILNTHELKGFFKIQTESNNSTRIFIKRNKCNKTNKCNKCSYSNCKNNYNHKSFHRDSFLNNYFLLDGCLINFLGLFTIFDKYLVTLYQQIISFHVNNRLPKVYNTHIKVRIN